MPFEINTIYNHIEKLESSVQSPGSENDINTNLEE